MKPLLQVSGALRVEYRVRLAPLDGDNTCLIQEERRVAGGEAGWCALAGARLGAWVRVRGWVGDDAHGRFLLAELEAAGVEVDVEVREGAATPYVILIRAPDGSIQTLLSPEAAREGASSEEQLLEALSHTLGGFFEAEEVARRLRVFEAGFGEVSAFDADFS